MKKSTLLVVAGLVVIVWLLSTSKGTKNIFNFKNNPDFKSTVYFVYSPTCPHCHELADYLQGLNLTVNVKAVTDGRFLVPYLQEAGISWQYSVPVMVGISDKVIAVEGYPSTEQNIEGYFGGQTYESQLCTSQGGYADGLPYDFCHLPNGFLLGNQNAVDYLLNHCKENTCKTV